jgi:hypothetical protein
VLLGIIGFFVGFSLLVTGLVSIIGFFGESNDLSRAFNLSTLAGLTLLVWTYLGITRPTPLRYIPPALGSLAVIAWFVFF